MGEEDMAAKAEKLTTLLDAIEVLEARRDALFSLLGFPKEEAEKVLTMNAIVDARNRILQVSRNLSDVLENLKKKRVQLQVEFGEKLL